MPKINAYRGLLTHAIGSSPPSTQPETTILDVEVIERDQLLTDCALVYPNVMSRMSHREGADQHSERPQFMSMPFKADTRPACTQALWLFMLIT